MTQCWGEGDLRAFLDGELPVEQAAVVERHLAECAGCAAAYRTLSDRAALVSSLMQELSADVPSAARLPRRMAIHPMWWGAAAALAAGLILAVLLARESFRPPVKAEVQAPRPAPIAAPLREEPPVTEVAAQQRRRIPRPPVRPARATAVQYYVGLDEEPIETGLVMRVALPSGIQADVIVDGDGRPRAIRPIQAVGKEDER